MSTRATYQFINDGHPTTIYIHHDGYPEGAASYLWNLLHAKNERGCLATQFLRANDNAEITESHEIHGDTEYRYTVQEDGQLKAEKIIRNWKDESHTTETFFVGHFAEFVNKYGAEQCGGFEPLMKVKTNRYTEHFRWMTPTQLLAELENKVKERESYVARFPQHTGNIDSMTQQIEFLMEQVKKHVPA